MGVIPATNKSFVTIHEKTKINVQVSAPDFFSITEQLLQKTMKIQLEENVVTLRAILEDKFAAPDIIMMAARINSYTERGLNQVVI